MDPTIANFVRMISGVRQRPLISPHLLNSVWSFGGLLKIADTTHAMEVPQLPPHSDFVTLDVTQGETLLERWWIGSESSALYRNKQKDRARKQRESTRNNEEDEKDDDSSSSSSSSSSSASVDSNTVQIRSSDVIPAVSFGPLKIVVRCVYAYLVASDTGLRGLNIRSLEAKSVIAPDTPLIVRISRTAHRHPSSLSTHTRSERPFCSDWRCDTGSPDLGTVIVSVRRMFTPVIALSPEEEQMKALRRQREDEHAAALAAAAAAKQAQQQQQQQPVQNTSFPNDPNKLVTPSLRDTSPAVSDGTASRTTPVMAQIQHNHHHHHHQLSTDTGPDDELPPMKLPSAATSSHNQHLLPPAPGDYVSSSARSSGLGGGDDSSAATSSASSQQYPSYPASAGASTLVAPKLTPLMGPLRPVAAFASRTATTTSSSMNAGNNNNNNNNNDDDKDNNSNIIITGQSAMATMTMGQRSDSSSSDYYQQHRIPEPTPEQQQLHRLMGTPHRSFEQQNHDWAGAEGAGQQQQQQQQQYHNLLYENGQENSGQHHLPQPERITDDNYGCAISTTSVFHSSSWSWEHSSGAALLRPSAERDGRRSLLLPGTLGCQSCFEDDNTSSSSDFSSAAAAAAASLLATDGGAAQATEAHEAIVVDLLQALDTLEFVRAHCDTRRSMQQYHRQLASAATTTGKKRSPAIAPSPAPGGSGAAAVGSSGAAAAAAAAAGGGAGSQQKALLMMLPSATETIESVIDQLNSAQDNLMRLMASSESA